MKDLLVIPYWEDFDDILGKSRPARLCNKALEYPMSEDVTKNMVFMTSIEQLEELIESGDANLTMSFGLHLRPQLDYETGDKLFGIVERLSKCKNFDNLKWRFANGWDIYNLDEEERRNWLIDQTRLIKQENIIIHINNFLTVKDYKKALPDADVQFYNIYYNRIFFNNEKFDFQPNIEKRNKHFVAFNGRVCWHRDVIVDHIVNNHKDKCYYSYIEKNITLGIQNSKNSDTGTTPTYEMFNREHEDWMAKPSYSVINDSYVQVVTESFFDPNSIAVAFNGINEQGNSDINIKPIGTPNGLITEKTYKTFLYEQPMLLVAFPGILAQLKEMGYKTFPEFFDEDYDTEQHHHNRMHKIIASLDKFMQMDLNKVHELYHSDSVQEKLKHNKKLFLKNTFESPINKWFVPNKQYQLS